MPLFDHNGDCNEDESRTQHIKIIFTKFQIPTLPNYLDKAGFTHKNLTPFIAFLFVFITTVSVTGCDDEPIWMVSQRQFHYAIVDWEFRFFPSRNGEHWCQGSERTFISRRIDPRFDDFDPSIT